MNIKVSALLAGCLALLVLAAAPRPAEAGRPGKVIAKRAGTARVVAGTDGRYYTKNSRFGAWSRVQIDGGPSKSGKPTGKETITHIYMPSSVTTLGIHKEPVPGAFSRLVRKLQGKSPALDGKRLPVELSRP